MAEVRLTNGDGYEVGVYRGIWLMTAASYADDVDFTEPITMTPTEARALAATLLKAADDAEKMAAP